MPLGIEAPTAKLRHTFLRPPAADDVVEEALSSLRQPLVLLHPGSHGSAGNWPPERFADLAHSLAQEGLAVAFTGTAEEGREFAPHFPDVDRVYSWFGRFNLEQLMAVQSRSDAVVASSTGPLHTATAMGTPGVGLYGKTAPAWAERWAPIGPLVTVVEADGLDLHGHLDISVNEVKSAVLAFTAGAAQS